MKNVDWTAYQLFMAVARHGGLSAAAEQLETSPATLGRHILKLEQAVGRHLFVRSPTGYELTVDGQSLFTELLEMEGASRRLDEWFGKADGLGTVRLAAGSWVGRLLAQNFSKISAAQDPFSIEMHISEERAKLLHRENDVGIRAVEPTERNLASIKTGEVAYCAYRLRNMPVTNYDRWIAVNEQVAVSPYLIWPHRHHRDQLRVTVDRARDILDLLLSGAGNAVLPCFVGDTEPQLERVGGEIADLRHGQWIVANDDDRNISSIRRVVDRVTRLLKSHAKLFTGQRSPTT